MAKEGKKKKKSGFFKELMRKRVNIKIIAGGHILTDDDSAKDIMNRAVILQGDKSGEVVVDSFFDKKTFTFNRISWEQSAERSGGKAAVGAIAGTMVAGPLGTIAGAAIGGKKKDTSSAFLYLTDGDGEEHEIHIECTKQLYMEIGRLPW